MPEETSYENIMERARRSADGMKERYGTCGAVCESARSMRAGTFEAFGGCGTMMLGGSF